MDSNRIVYYSDASCTGYGG